MKKKTFVLVCVTLVIFFGSCADLSMDKEDAVRADLPDDFDWKVYGEINGDVLMSQIIIDLRERAEDPENCAEMFSSNTDFAKVVYSDYLQCPVDGWHKKFENNPKYGCVPRPSSSSSDDSSSSGDSSSSDDSSSSGVSSSSDVSSSSGDSSSSDESSSSGNSSSSDESSSSSESSIEVRLPLHGPPLDSICHIEDCWEGGWDELETSFLNPNKEPVIKAMCKFIPKGSTAATAKDYLEDFKKNRFDPYLVEQHYHFFGRSDGRPYKYCGSDKGVEKNQSLHADKRTGSSNYYYDYGRYTFCLDSTDWKIYVVK